MGEEASVQVAPILAASHQVYQRQCQEEVRRDEAQVEEEEAQKMGEAAIVCNFAAEEVGDGNCCSAREVVVEGCTVGVGCPWLEG